MGRDQGQRRQQSNGRTRREDEESLHPTARAPIPILQHLHLLWPSAGRVWAFPEPWRALTRREEQRWRLQGWVAAVGAVPGGVGPAAWEGWDGAGMQSKTPGGKMLINCSASLKGAKCK